MFFDQFDKSDVNFIKVCEYFIFFKIHIIVRSLNNFNLTFDKAGKHENKINLIKIILLIIFSAHILAILLFSVSLIEVRYIQSEN